MTVGPTRRPRATAFRASSPAPTMTVGLRGVRARGDGRDRDRAVTDDRVPAPPTVDRATPPLSVAPVVPPSSVSRAEVLAGRRRSAPVGGEGRPEVRRQAGQRDAVLRPARPGDRRLDARQVERRAARRTSGRRPARATGPAPWRSARRASTRSARPAGQAQVGERLVVDREERRGRPELGAHVADRGPVGQRQAGQAVAGELDERADDAVRPQHLGDDQDEVGRGRAARQLAGAAGRRRRAASAGRAAGRAGRPRPRCPPTP